MYVDASSGNFTLPGNSPMLNRADDGSTLGDLRWATNPATVYPLDYSVAGDGSVMVEPKNAGDVYLPNSSVNLTAVPSLGYKFSNWEGDASGTDSSIIIKMDSPKDVVAVFNFLTDVNDDKQPKELSLIHI